MLILVRGLPGSGKSTFAKKFGLPNFEADDYFTSAHPACKYVFDASKLQEAHLQCQRLTDDALALGSSVVVSNTFTTVKELQSYLDIAAKRSAEFVVFKMLGEYGSVHGVPEQTMDRMRRRWEPFPGEIEIYPK